MKRMVVVLMIAALLSGCADRVSFDQAAARVQVGFWYGFWHGFIALISWAVTFFDSHVAIYAIYNNGGWYDFGFLLGTGSLFTGVVDLLVIAFNALVVGFAMILEALNQFRRKGERNRSN